MPGFRPKERPAAPLHGFKLAHPMVSADGTRGGFSGVSLGRSRVYGVVADAECAQGSQHRCPSRWCDCGFYCVHTLDDARALACDPDYRYAVLLEVAVSGRFMRYERGLRYARQRIAEVRIGRCGCGHSATMLSYTGDGVVGWRRLMAVCPDCADGRRRVSLGEFARLLDGPSVKADDAGRAQDPGYGVTTAATTSEADLVPLLSAEVALLQARLDEVQRQLARLTDSE
jgi:hypothetical protein